MFLLLGVKTGVFRGPDVPECVHQGRPRGRLTGHNTFPGSLVLTLLGPHEYSSVLPSP